MNIPKHVRSTMAQFRHLLFHVVFKKRLFVSFIIYVYAAIFFIIITVRYISHPLFGGKGGRLIKPPLLLDPRIKKSLF